MTKHLKVVFASSEAVPFSKTGGLADVSGTLPVFLKKSGCDVKVFLPFYRQTKNRNLDIKPLGKTLRAELGNWNQFFSLYHANNAGVDFYFIDHDEYYNRDFLYGTPDGDYYDNDVRFAFFSNAVLSSLSDMEFAPNIIHCNDWQTALIPFYLKHKLNNTGFFKNTKTLYTIHNIAYQGIFSSQTIDRAGIGSDFFNANGFEFYGNVNFMKGGIIYSDIITTVSKGYINDILTPEYGYGLEGVIKTKRDKLFGILNGSDYDEWDPKTDKNIAANFTIEDISNKKICRADLLKTMKLSENFSGPIIGMVSRLASQKGIDILIPIIDEIVKSGACIIILGAGEAKYHSILYGFQGRYPNNIAVKIAFDNTLAHKIEAGADMFIMPSKYEPCGLNQMYSFKYGTVPIVHATGGLDDTIIDYNEDKLNGNGFKFRVYNAGSFMDAVSRAVNLYHTREEWQLLIKRIMSLDFSWEKSSKEYIKLYSQTVEKK